MGRLRTKYLPLVVLLAISQPACDLDFSGLGEGLGEGLEHVDDYEMGPWPAPIPAITVVVQPFLADSGNWVFGTIRHGSYLDSLSVPWWQRDGRSVAMVLQAGIDFPNGPRLGTYDVTVAAPGYATWDTTGVVVQAGDKGQVRGVRLEVQLEEIP
jgi:hypothetical protein